jgi:cold shock CspA family protein
MKGFLKTLKLNGNFGFIKAENGGEYFFHKADFEGFWEDLVADYNQPNYGQIPMTFEVVSSPKGPRGSNVRRTDYPNNDA